MLIETVNVPAPVMIQPELEYRRPAPVASVPEEWERQTSHMGWSDHGTSKKLQNGSLTLEEEVNALACIVVDFCLANARSEDGRRSLDALERFFVTTDGQTTTIN